MKKTFLDEVYNLDTATCCGEYGYYNPRCNPEPDHFRVGLYKTRESGEYFLFGVGGAETLYFLPTIVPMTKDEAREWAIDHLDEEEYNLEFAR